VDIANATTTPTSTSLAWSSTNTSYAFAGLGFNSAIYQRLGVDASSPSPQSPFTHTFTPAHPVVIGVAPDGVWGVAFGGSNPGLALFNPDGSRTLSPVTLGTGGVIPHALDMVHDGTTWLTVWTHSPSRTTISANRTAQPNSQVAIVTVPTPTAIWSPALQVSGSVATMAWAQAASDTQYSKIRLQRFSIPAGTSSALTPIHNAIDVLATANTTGDRPGLVRTGPTSLLVVWSDNRFGVNQSEIFAAPVSLGACP
jgi:hypothetical protein